ncbi:23636_t:CDS:2, partial [Cetraspora pellucida]
AIVFQSGFAVTTQSSGLCHLHIQCKHDIKEKCVGAYTSQIIYFETTTTQHVKGIHSAMKHAIETFESLIRSFKLIDR